jgi:septation ring formation regulator EzrA
MKKNIIIIISIIVVLVIVVAVIASMKTPEKKEVVKQPVYTDAVSDIKNDLNAIDFGNSSKDFEAVNKDIQSL